MSARAFLNLAVLSIVAAGMAACGGATSSSSVPSAQRQPFKTQYYPASLPAVTAEYTLVTTNATPRGLALASDGSIVFAEEYGHALGRITQQGAVTEGPIAAFPAEVTFDSAGNLWFTEPLLQDSLVKVQPNNQITRYMVPAVGGAEPFPTGIAAQPGSSGAVWFTNPGTNTLGRIDSTGTLATFTAPGSPSGIVFGSDGAIYFTELNGDQIGRMDTSGTLTNQYPVPTKNNLPTGITAGPSGSLWFTENGCLVKGPTACVYGKIGRLSGGAIAEYDAQSDPVAIVLGDDGNLWFTASFANKIGRITPGGVVTLYPVPTPNSQPFDVAKGPNRTLWFSERAAGKIGVFSY